MESLVTDMSQSLFFKIIDECNKKCSFCPYTNDNKEAQMSFEVFKGLVARVRTNSNLMLFGGEPTLHPEFLVFVEHLLASNKRTNFSTNLLCDINILKEACALAEKYKGRLRVMINAQELDPKYEEQFLANLDFLSKVKRSNKFDFDVKSNFVIDLAKTPEENKREVDVLYKLFGNKIDMLNMAPRIGNTKIIGRADTAKEILEVVKYAREKFKDSYLTHELYPCNFNNKEERDEYSKYVAVMHYLLGCCGISLLIDEKYLHTCIYGDPEMRLDHRKYTFLEDAYDDLDKIRAERVKTTMPNECKTCKLECKKMICNKIF